MDASPWRTLLRIMKMAAIINNPSGTSMANTISPTSQSRFNFVSAERTMKGVPLRSLDKAATRTDLAIELAIVVELAILEWLGGARQLDIARHCFSTRIDNFVKQLVITVD